MGIILDGMPYLCYLITMGQNGKSASTFIIISAAIVLVTVGFFAYQKYHNDSNALQPPIVMNATTTTPETISISVSPAATTVPSNGLSNGMANTAIEAYFYDPVFGNQEPTKLPPDLDWQTFTMLPTNYTVVSDTIQVGVGVAYAPLKLPDGTAIQFMQDAFYAKDKNHVYYFGRVLPNADPATFTLINDSPNSSFIPQSNVAKDKNYVWVRGQIFPAADSQTFAPLVIEGNGTSFFHFFQDKNHVYNMNPISSPTPQIVPQANPKTFAIIDNNFEKSGNFLYYQGNFIDGANPGTFRIVSGTDDLYTDNNHLFDLSLDSIKQVSTTIDVSTFTPLPSGYFADKNSVYTGDNYAGGYVFDALAGSDPTTFQVLGICGSEEKSAAFYAKDKNHVYCGNEIVNVADPGTFVYVGSYNNNPGGMNSSIGIGKDKNCIYQANTPVKNNSGVCISPAACTTQSLGSNPASCGITQ
jgi:hypothetical protein